MNAYITMTFIGLTAKLIAMHSLTRRWRTTTLNILILGLILSLLAQSVCEFMLYAYADHPESPGAHAAIIGYYCFACIDILLLPFIVTLAIDKQVNRYLAVAAAMTGIMIVTALITSDLIITDVERLKYALTGIQGPYYWIFQIGALLAFFFSAFTLWKGTMSPDSYKRVKSTNLLLAFLPVLLFGVAVIFFMQAGYKINAVGILPLCAALYITALIQNTGSQAIPDYLFYIPWSKKARIARKLSKPFRVIDLTPSDSKQLAKEYEQALVEHAIEILNDRKKAAEWLNISQAKISKLIGKRRTDDTFQKP